MPVTDVTTDTARRTITITAEFAAPVERVWEMYADPRQLEQVDGGTRATFTSVYDSAEGLQQVLDMGVEEGATGSINQIDGFLAA
ncbi:hypothetical protein [uncultured Serinicoccus sp.]|uniref:SRPBCC family protein n=1 Tax=uncultured Serinicoccus sp. TaxID=735514 RepID=UPI002606E675|nr:hypothetical protein [uncultured Serinicoccus sp.]